MWDEIVGEGFRYCMDLERLLYTFPARMSGNKG